MAHTITGSGSIDRRPDAFSSDYSFAHSFGPIQLSDFTQGLYVRTWRVRVDNATNIVYLCRNNDTNDAWEAETVLFSFDGPPILELDEAFDQQGRVFVCAERATGEGGASEVWAYFYDSLLGAYAFEMKGAGRTPKCLLDDVVDTANGDVLVFYMNDAVGMCWRQQRDRYNTEYVVALIASPELVDINGENTKTPVGPLTWEFAPGVYHNDVDNQEWGGFEASYSPSVPGYSIHGTALGAYQPFPPTLIGGLRSQMFGYFQESSSHEEPFYIIFDPPITGFTATAIGAEWDGDRINAYVTPLDWAGGGVLPIASALFTKTSGAVAECTRSLFAPAIGIVTFTPAAGNMTRLKNIHIRLSALPAPIPLPADLPYPAARTYIEDLYKATDGRVHILYSLRNLVTGQYTLYHYETLQYPHVLWGTDGIQGSVSFPDDNELRRILLIFDSSGVYEGAYPQLEGEGTVGSAEVTDGELHEMLIILILFDIEATTGALSVQATSSLVVTGPNMIYKTLYDIEAATAAMTITGAGSMYVALISATLYDIEASTASLTIQAASTLV